MNSSPSQTRNITPHIPSILDTECEQYVLQKFLPNLEIIEMMRVNGLHYHPLEEQNNPKHNETLKDFFQMFFLIL